MIKKIFKIITILGFLLSIIVFGINFFIVSSTQDQIITKEEYCNLEDIDCILILGAGIRGEEPTPMLKDRLDQGIELYLEKENILVMSGDHGTDYHNEVGVMKNYAIKENISSEDIFMDDAGFITYESIYRIKEIFGAKKIIIVTQKYHLHRALYLANAFELEAYGVNSDPRQYSGQTNREIREIIARNKDFLFSIIKPKPTYLGESISLTESGDITND